MICPQCGAEYRQAFTQCRKCGFALDGSSVKEGSEAVASREGNILLLWAGDDLALHAALLEELKAAQIPYLNRPISEYSLKAFPNHFPGGSTPVFGFEVGVFSSDFETAKSILEELEDARKDPPAE